MLLSLNVLGKNVVSTEGYPLLKLGCGYGGLFGAAVSGGHLTAATHC